ncbi:hypothetical protein BD309DRAFT_959390 [Dichomitus squalens]|nr:hypothetical protein BD309DRAFT_959390 [Dichomitus squalens]
MLLPGLCAPSMVVVCIGHAVWQDTPPGCVDLPNSAPQQDRERDMGRRKRRRNLLDVAGTPALRPRSCAERGQAVPGVFARRAQVIAADASPQVAYRTVVQCLGRGGETTFVGGDCFLLLHLHHVQPRLLRRRRPAAVLPSPGPSPWPGWLLPPAAPASLWPAALRRPALWPAALSASAPSADRLRTTARQGWRRRMHGMSGGNVFVLLC